MDETATETAADVTSKRRIKLRPKERARNWIERNGPSLLVVIGILIVWEFYSRYINQIGNIFFPSITYSINQTLANLDKVIAATQLTFAEVFAGFIAGVVLGVMVGIIYAESFILRQASMPMLIFVYSLPLAIVAPVFIVWFGTGIFAVGAFVGLFSFFPVFVNTITGLTQVEEEFSHLGKVIGASEAQYMRYIKFWVAFPHIIGGIRIAVQQSIVGAIVAEFIASGGGLGNLIVVASNTAQLGLLFGTLFLIMVIAIIYFKVVSFAIDYVTPGPSSL